MSEEKKNPFKSFLKGTAVVAAASGTIFGLGQWRNHDHPEATNDTDLDNSVSVAVNAAVDAQNEGPNYLHPKDAPFTSRVAAEKPAETNSLTRK